VQKNQRENNGEELPINSTFIQPDEESQRGNNGETNEEIPLNSTSGVQPDDESQGSYLGSEVNDPITETTCNKADQ